MELDTVTSFPLVFEDEESSGGFLPWIIVLPFSLAGMIWKFGLISTVFLPQWSILATFALVDWIVDWVFLLTLGLFCKPCAGLFIWIINLVYIPFMIWGWLQRLILEVFAFPIKGWLVFLGNGCFLRFGAECWMEGVYRLKDRTLRTYFDVPWFTTGELLEDLKLRVLPPQIDGAASFLTARAEGRKALTKQIPMYNEAVQGVEMFM